MQEFLEERNSVGGDRELEGTVPITDYESKTVMLRAERKDSLRIIEIVDRGPSVNSIPSKYSVAQRTNAYFGPKLVLDHNGDLYQLTAPGPDSYLLLWKLESRTEERNQRWRKIAEVRADFAEDTPEYEICAECGEPIQTAEHNRLSLIGRCPGTN